MRYILNFCLLLCLLPSANAEPTNTSPRIMEGERLELSLSEDDSTFSFVLTASDAEYDKLNWSVAKNAQHGTIRMVGSNSVQTIHYTPHLHYYGNDNFTIQVTDIHDEMDLIDIILSITPVNDNPVALRNETIQVPYGSPMQAYELENYFYDIDNSHHELRYEIVNNTQPHIVYATIKKNILKLTYEQSGEAIITIEGIDLEGLSATVEFYITITPINSKIELLSAFPPTSQIGQAVTFSFQVSNELGVAPTGLVTVSNGVQSCHDKLETKDRGFGSCQLTLPEYQDYHFYAEYTGNNDFQASETQDDFIYSTKPKALVYNVKKREFYELSEDGMGDSYTISLSQLPTAAVELTLTPDKQLTINELGAGQAATFILTDTQPIDIFLTAADDQLVEGWHDGEILHQTQSQDRDYHNLTSTLQFPIRDNDAGIIIKQGLNQLVEEETTDNYTIYLSTTPQKSVDIKIESYDNQLLTYPNHLLFNNENWSQARNVQISAVPDEILEDVHFATLYHSVSSQDMNYGKNLVFNINNENTNAFDVKIIDNDIEQPPNSPTEFKAVVIEENQILLNWHDNSDNEEQFMLKRHDLKNPISLPENSRFYQDIEVRCNQTYQYEISSVNKKGRSLLKVEIDVKTVPCTELVAPTQLAAFLVDDKYINLIWNDTNNSEQGYIVERDGNEIAKVPAHTVAYRDTDFTCSMTYQYTVKAYASRNKQSPPARVSLRTKACEGEYKLTLKIEGKGMVNGCSQECEQTYPNNQLIEFRVKPALNWQFERWEGDCDTNQVVMNADKICIVHFAPSEPE